MAAVAVERATPRRACAAGTELGVVEDSVAAARHAAACGLIRADDVAEVAPDRRLVEALPSPVEPVLES